MPANIFSNSIKNWDNKTWLSSLSYIRSFNKFLIKNTKLNRTAKIVDVGCGRGKILGHLLDKLKLKTIPLGIDLESHKDRDKRFNFKQIDALTFFKKNNEHFDLILIKQTIHLFKIIKIKKLLKLCRNKLNQKGKIIILTLDPDHNQIPTFPLMAQQLKISLERDKKIVKLIPVFPLNIIYNLRGNSRGLQNLYGFLSIRFRQSSLNIYLNMFLAKVLLLKRFPVFIVQNYKFFDLRVLRQPLIDFGTSAPILKLRGIAQNCLFRDP